MDSNSAIDLSLRPIPHSIIPNQVPIIRPIPRLPWTITWYQSMWAVNHSHVTNSSLNKTNPYLTAEKVDRGRKTAVGKVTETFSESINGNTATASNIPCQTNIGQPDADTGQNNPVREITEEEAEKPLEKGITLEDSLSLGTLSTILDIACCDGPVVFERVSNPNFALTVEHNESTSEHGSKIADRDRRHLALKTYLCIYCSQSFKSLFCYQKHKKRHLNPVSVDITATHDTSKHNNAENKAKTKDLNVQFFPCKKCGCKFPSYYFVHKHRKVCHLMQLGSQ